MAFNPVLSLFKKPKPKTPDPALPYFQEDRDRLGGMLGGHDPYASGEWDGLIGQLTAQANGTGPSLAEQAYRRQTMDTAGRLAGMAHSGSPAAARTAMIQQGRLGQGMAAGVAEARTREQLGAQSALGQALGQRDQLNQNAYLDILGKQLGLSKDQLAALLANQQSRDARYAADKQASAAKWSALGGALGGLGMLGG